MASRNQEKEDLDAFLTALEAKMRGPYSSLELAKAVTLRGSMSPQEYLQNISRVLSRTDKMTQLRTLVGLLGLEPGRDTDQAVFKILTQSLEAPAHEEWVRVVAGLTRGIMFVDDNEEGSRVSCRGGEANSLLEKTCTEIVDQTRQLEDKTKNADSNVASSLLTADMYPLFVSYRYSLLDPDLLDLVIPEQKEKNTHFQINYDADILTMDGALEKARAEEAQEHEARAVMQTSTGERNQSTTKSPEIAKNVSRPTKNAVGKTVTRPKTSMFMPTKRPGLPSGRGGRQVPMKGSLHTRRAGAAQALLGTSRGARGNGIGGRPTGSGASASIGRAQKLANSKSKMKMIDVKEVEGLNHEHKERDDKIAKEESREQKLLARKRKIMEAAAEKGLVALPKIRKVEESARAARGKQSPSHGQQIPANDNVISFNQPHYDDSKTSQEWLSILNERSNKLSAEDRSRVEQFFTNRYNPTPEQPIYKMKLHEERTTDEATGQAMKETYYLELDYSTFTSKQSKKTKRY